MKIGISETLFLELKEPNVEAQRYRCRIVEKSETEIFIDLPINEETKKTGFFPLGTRFKAWTTDSNSVMYTFNTELLEKRKGKIPMLVLAFPDENKIVKTQRRAFVRIDTSVDVAVHPEDELHKSFTTMTVDLSGGGTAITLPTSHTLQEGEKLICWFVLPMQSGERHYLTIKCEVIRIYKDKVSPRDRASLNFINITEQDRAHIIRFCFEKEIYLKRSRI